MKLLRKRWKLLGVLALILLGGWWWYASSTANRTPTYITQTPRRGDLIQTIEVSGKVDAEEKVRLRFMNGGKVVYLSAKEGEYVEKNQRIATIDQALLQKQLQQDLNRYSQERWDWEQLRDDVVENNDIPEPIPDLRTRRTVDKAQWDLDNSVLNVEIRSIAIRDTHLVSPIRGILTTSPTQVTGMQLTPTDYFEVINTETLVFRAEVDEEDIGKVALGQLVKVSLDSFPDVTMDSAISYIPFTSSVSSSGTVFVVKIPMAQAGVQYPVRIGMSGDASIEVGKVFGALSVPIEALRERDGTTYVDVVTPEGEIKERVVITGLETEDEVEIIRGLTETDQVLIPQ